MLFNLLKIVAYANNAVERVSMARAFVTSDANERTVLSIDQVAVRLGLSVRTIERYTKDDSNFPKPIRLGVRRKGWLIRDIEQWLTEQAELANGVRMVS